jgi:hypothetical protein
MEDEKALNPDIRDIFYGKKKLTKLTLYPLSVGDQFKVTEIISGVVQNLVKEHTISNFNDIVFMTAVIGAVEENICKILTLISDCTDEEAKAIISDLTNNQLMDVVESIWIVDYEPMLKKGKSLFERGKSVFGLKSLSQNSSDSTLNTDSMTSIENIIDKEE